MTTAELIKNKEEKKNNPPLSPTTSPFKPAEGMSMAEARVVGGMPEAERENVVSLYDDGVNSDNKTTINGSPINTPEYQNMREQLVKPEDFGIETPEQAAARERREKIKLGLTGLTEGLSALANLYYTTKGAPSQKIKSNMPELQKRLYQERLERDKKLDKFRDYIRGKADKAEERDYQEKVRAEENARQDAIRKEQAAENKRRWEYTNQKQEEATAKADARYEAEQAYKREQDALANKHRSAQLAETRRYHDSLIANRANGGKGSGTSVMHGKNGTSILNTPNGFMDVDWKKVDPVAKQQMYKIVPEEIRNKYPLKENEYSEYDEKYATSQMNAAIAEAAVTDEKIAKWLVDSKTGVYQQQEANPIHSNTQSSAQANEGQQNSGGSKWDSYDITDGKKAGTDFSKQKRPSQRGAAESSQMSNVSVASVPSAPATQSALTDSESDKLKGIDRYKAMVDKDNKEAELERKAKEERIKKASAKRANTVQEAKALRKELNAILNEDLPEFDIEKFISDNSIGFLDAMKYRMQYADDDKERAKIKRKIQRLNDIIGNG